MTRIGYNFSRRNFRRAPTVLPIGPSNFEKKENVIIQVILDATMQSKLGNFSQPVELCDATGRVLGRVFPAPDLSQCEPLVPQVSEEELDRREQANEKRFTTAEVLARLKKL